MLTHQGVSYSRSFVVSLVAAGLVSTVLMLAIGNNLARGIGIVGTLALIRFRMQMHDSLDMIYVFAAFAGGVAAGTGNFATGAIGTVAFLVVVGTLQLTGFGSRHRHDGVLRVQLPASEESESGAGGLAQGPTAGSSPPSPCAKWPRVVNSSASIRSPCARPGKEALWSRKWPASTGAHGVSIAMQEATHEI